MKIKIIGKKNCSYCVSATSLCNVKDKNYEYISFEDMSPDEFHLMLANEAKGATTFPIIFIDEKYIGGFTELKEFFDAQK